MKMLLRIVLIVLLLSLPVCGQKILHVGQFGGHRILYDLGRGALTEQSLLEYDIILLGDLQDLRPKQKELEAVQRVDAIFRNAGKAIPLKVFACRIYRFFPGSQWGDDGPTAEMSARPESGLPPLIWFTGYMAGAGWTRAGTDLGIMPYSIGLNQELKRYWFVSYEMDMKNNGWMNLLSDYLVRTGASLGIENWGIMLHTLKSQRYWHPSMRKQRAPDLSGSNYSHMLDWMFNHRWQPDAERWKQVPSIGHFAYTDTRTPDHLKSVCMIPGKLRSRTWSLPRHRRPQIVVPIERWWDGRYFLSLVRYLGSERRARELIEKKIYQAAWGADLLIWPSANPRDQAWVAPLRKKVEARAEVVTQ
jgi:hypothetical protein